MRRAHGYTLTRAADDTTYTVDVNKRGTKDPMAVAQKPLASSKARTALEPDGRVHWRDQVADVTITAVGPAGHTRRGLQTIGKRMVVVPQSVLNRLADATRAKRNRKVDLDPIEFPVGGVSLRRRCTAGWAEATISIESPSVIAGTGVCFACDRVNWFTGWRDGGTTYSLVGVVPKMVVDAPQAVTVERVFDPAAGSGTRPPQHPPPRQSGRVRRPVERRPHRGSSPGGNGLTGRSYTTWNSMR